MAFNTQVNSTWPNKDLGRVHFVTQPAGYSNSRVKSMSFVTLWFIVSRILNSPSYETVGAIDSASKVNGNFWFS